MSIATNMRAHILLILPLLFLLGCKSFHQSSSPDRDTQLARDIVGTWVNAAANEQPLYIESLYRADGTGEELVWAKGQSKTNAVQIQTVWMIKNGILSTMHLRSSDPKLMPDGRTTKDRILSMSKDNFTYVELEGGYPPGIRNTLVKLRK